MIIIGLDSHDLTNLTTFAAEHGVGRKRVMLETGEQTGHFCKVLDGILRVLVRIMALEVARTV